MIRVPKIFVRFERFVFKEKSVFISFLSVCPKHSLFERFVFKERIRVYLCLSVCQKYSICVQRKSVFKKSSPPKSHTPMQNPDGPPLSYLSCPETTIPVSRHDHYHYFFTSLHNLLAIHNIHTMRQAADTGTYSDASAVKGIDATFLCINITA